MPKGNTRILHDRKLLLRFLRQASGISDTPSLIRLVSEDAGYMALCEHIINTAEEEDPEFFSLLRAECRNLAVDFNNMRESLKPVARALGLASKESGGLDYYDILGVEPEATLEEVKRSFRRRALQVHPDTGGDQEGEHTFLELNEAYRTLSDPALREQYDRSRDRMDSWKEHAFSVQEKGESGPRRMRRYMWQLGGVLLLLVAAAFILDSLHRQQALSEWFYAPESSDTPAGESEIKGDQVVKAYGPIQKVPEIREAVPGDERMSRPPGDGEKTRMAMYDWSAHTEYGLETGREGHIKQGGRKGKTEAAEKSAAPGATMKGARKPRTARKTRETAASQSRAKTLEKGESTAGKKESGREEKRVSAGPGGGAESSKIALKSEKTAKETRDSKGTREKALRGEGSSGRKMQSVSPAGGKKDPEGAPQERAAAVAAKEEEKPGDQPKANKEDRGQKKDASPEERLREFLRDYCEAYERKDLEDFRAFFASEATENGVPFQKLRLRYRRTFESIESLDYRIKLLNYYTLIKTGKIRVNGRYVMKWKTYEGEKGKDTGRISMILEKSDRSYLVKEFNYRGGG